LLNQATTLIAVRINRYPSVEREAVLARHIRRIPAISAGLISILVLFTSISHATFSIIAYDAEAKEWGVAVASREVAVGHAVPWARVNAGVVATQAWINPLFGMDGLDMMENGFSAQQTLTALLERDEEDDTRQLALIDASGNVAAFSGTKLGNWFGDLQGEGYSIQGNTLATDSVLIKMEQAFLGTRGPLALRLINALLAGDAEGGDRRGRQSASLLVVREGAGLRGVMDVFYDLRIDNHPEAPAELAEAFKQWSCQVAIYYYLEHENAGDNEKGLLLLDWIEDRAKAGEEPDILTLYTLADMMSRLNLYPDRALEIATYVHGFLPDNAAVLSVIAECHFAAGDIETAAQWNEKALAIQPTSISIGKQAERIREAAD
jgi:uncharacterized Ntn-hydrolase superfamily protein